MKKLWLPVLCIVLLVLPPVALSQSNNDFLQGLPGKIAYIGIDHNVYTLDFARAETTQLTTNGSRRMSYQWVTWSNDGRLAYFCCDLQTAATADTAAYISVDGHQPGEKVFEGFGEAIIYAYWSPGECSEGEHCRDLALLVNDVFDGSLRLDLVRHADEGSTIRTAGAGAPFYYSWSPDGSQLVFHRFNRQVEIYDVAQGKVTATVEAGSSGTFQAPAWSPVDNRILSGIPGVDPRKTRLAITVGGSSEALIKEFGGFVSFTWSPDGRYVAYRLVSDNQFGALFVVDALTGEVISRSITAGVIAFFWSPDSHKLAYVTLAGTGNNEAAAEPRRIPVQGVQNNNRLSLDWATLDVETGLNRRYTAFTPAPQMIYLLLYFDQFTQSHHVWSPDSRSIVYTESVLAGSVERPVVSVLDVSQAGTEPVTAADGLFAVWSFE